MPERKIVEKGLDYNFANGLVFEFRYSADHRDAWAKRNEEDSSLWDIEIPVDIPDEEYEEFRKSFG